MNMGCPLDLWVSMTTGAMYQMGKIWWETTQVAYLDTRYWSIVHGRSFKMCSTLSTF